MKLVLAIIHNDDSAIASSALTADGFFVTKLSTTGGFLQVGNTTLLIGTEDERVDELVAILKKYCSKHTTTVPSLNSLGKGLRPDGIKSEITVGGATYFNAPALNYESLIEAMEKHRFYCSQGPIIHSLVVSGRIATIEFSGADTVIMSHRTRSVQKKTLEGTGRHKVSMEFKKDDGYLRFDLISPDGKRANTCAYFLDALGIHP